MDIPDPRSSRSSSVSTTVGGIAPLRRNESSRNHRWVQTAQTVKRHHWPYLVTLFSLYGTSSKRINDTVEENAVLVSRSTGLLNRVKVESIRTEFSVAFNLGATLCLKT